MLPSQFVFQHNFATDVPCVLIGTVGFISEFVEYRLFSLFTSFIFFEIFPEMSSWHLDKLLIVELGFDALLEQ